MESKHMYNESFSYSWVLHLKPASFDAKDYPHSRNLSVDSIDDGPFIEIDLKKMTPVLFPATTTHHESNDFDFPAVTSQPAGLVPADQLFVDGHLLPMHHVVIDDHHHDEETAATQPPLCRRQNLLCRCRKSLRRFLQNLQPCGKRAGRKSSRSQVAAVNSEAGYAGATDSRHRKSVDDGMMGSRRPFGAIGNLSSCSSCPTTPRRASHV